MNELWEPGDRVRVTGPDGETHWCAVLHDLTFARVVAPVADEWESDYRDEL